MRTMSALVHAPPVIASMVRRSQSRRVRCRTPSNPSAYARRRNPEPASCFQIDTARTFRSKVEDVVVRPHGEEPVSSDRGRLCIWLVVVDSSSNNVAVVEDEVGFGLFEVKADRARQNSRETHVDQGSPSTLLRVVNSLEQQPERNTTDETLARSDSCSCIVHCAIRTMLR